jgi:hypothetical protein
MIGASINEPGCFPFLKGNMGGPAVHTGRFLDGRPARRGGLFSCGVCHRLLTPFCTAPGSVAVPVLFVPAAVSAPEVLASPRGEGGLLAPVVPVAPFFIAPSDAPGPTLPWLDAPPVGCVVCAKAVGVASARIHADAKMIFFIHYLPRVRLIDPWETGTNRVRS